MPRPPETQTTRGPSPMTPERRYTRSEVDEILLRATTEDGGSDPSSTPSPAEGGARIAAGFAVKTPLEPPEAGTPGG